MRSFVVILAFGLFPLTLSIGCTRAAPETPKG